MDGALSQKDVNITQRLKFYRNQVQYEPEKEKEESLTEARSGKIEFPIEYWERDYLLNYFSKILTECCMLHVAHPKRDMRKFKKTVLWNNNR